MQHASPTPGKTNSLRIRTPEGIVFTLPLAGPVTRCLAWAIDLACTIVISQVLGKMLGLLGFFGQDVARAVATIAYFSVSLGYSIVLEWLWRGQTLGKRLLGLRVVDAHGLRLQGSQVVIRNLLRFVDSLPALYLVGGITCLLSRSAQRLGDLAANTVVIRTPQAIATNLDQLVAGHYNSLRAYPHLAARLRQRTTPHEASIALRALLRRDRLDPAARVELLATIAGHFRTTVTFPQEATEGISDEQYVRNVVDILYRTPTQAQQNASLDGRSTLP